MGHKSPVEVVGRRATALLKDRWHRDRESGQTTAEYGAVIAFFAILLILAIVVFRGGLGDAFERDSGSVGAYKPPVAVCDQNYSGGCVPPYPPDVDCDDLQLGGAPIRVRNDGDPHNLDPDGDGIACNN